MVDVVTSGVGCRLMVTATATCFASSSHAPVESIACRSFAFAAIRTCGYVWVLLTTKVLSLGEQMRLLRAGAEGSLLARRLEAVGLQDALEGLGGGTATSTVATTHHSRRSHFV